MMLVAFVPVLAQFIYSIASVPRLIALYRAKRSDQHSLSYAGMIAGGHAMMLLWSLTYANLIGLIVAYIFAIISSAMLLAVTIWYRAFPGGYIRGDPNTTRALLEVVWTIPVRGLKRRFKS